MPYIAALDRPSIDVLIEPLVARLREGGHIDGELNYAISKLVHEWVLEHPKGTRYTVLSDATKAMQDAHDEFYRVVVGPYEDEKSAQNGPVSSLDANTANRV